MSTSPAPTMSTTSASREAHLRGEHSPDLFEVWDEAARAGLHATCVYCARLYTADGQFTLDAIKTHRREPVGEVGRGYSGGNRQGRPVPTAKPASDKQIGFIRKLDGEKDTSHFAEDTLADLQRVRADLPILSRDASGLIDALMAAPRKQAPRPSAAPAGGAVTQDGMYRTPDGEIYKVQVAVHGSGNLYAKLLVVDEAAKSGTFEYAAGAIRKLRPEWRMTLEQAVEFGRLYGFCVKCGATLTDEGSIERGIGPICAGKGWA